MTDTPGSPTDRRSVEGLLEEARNHRGRLRIYAGGDGIGSVCIDADDFDNWLCELTAEVDRLREALPSPNLEAPAPAVTRVIASPAAGVQPSVPNGGDSGHFIPPIAASHSIPSTESPSPESDKTPGVASRSYNFGFECGFEAGRRSILDKIPSEPTQPPCSKCGGPHPFDTVVPSVVWNGVIRQADLPDYLCAPCIIRAFLDAGKSFTADIDGVPIEVRVDTMEAWDAMLISQENTTLRARIRELEMQLRSPSGVVVPPQEKA